MKKNSYKQKLLFIVFTLFTVLLFAEEEEKKLPDEKQIFLDEKRISSSDNSNTSNISPETAQRTGNFDSALAETTKSPIASLLQLLGALVIICLLAYIVIKFLKKSSQVFGTDDPYLRSVSSIHIAQGKSIHVITLGEKAYLIGVTDAAINKIGEVEDKNLVDAMNLEADRKTASPKKNFASMLAAFFPQAKQNEQAGKEEAYSPEDFFTAQRNRLNNAARQMKSGNDAPPEESV